VTLGAVLLAVFLVIVAVMVWQEGRRRGPGGEPPTYVVEDAVEHVVNGLGGRGPLRRSDVRRIIEYEVFYLQGLAQPRRRTPVEVVAGGADAAVDFIAGRIADAHGVAYAHDDIRAVLALEAEYLASIGAVGEPVDETLLGGDDE
jgi:hypothetical protein